MDTTVKDIMRTEFPALKKTDSLADAIDVFVRNPDMVFPVIDNKGRIVGEVNQHDLLKLAVPAKDVEAIRILGPGGVRDILEHHAKKVADIMTTNDLRIKIDTKIVEVAHIMLDTQIRTLEIINESGEQVGFVSELDILRYLQKKLKQKK